MRSRSSLALALLVAASSSACRTTLLEDDPPDGGRVCETPVEFPGETSKLDVLFVIDSSNGMDAKLTELKNRLPQFFKPFFDLAERGTFADLHIGVVTTDYGAGATGAPGCSPSPGGQQGRLVALGAKAPPTCKRPLGVNFIRYTFGAGGESTVNNLPPGQNLVDTFSCIASVGATGCSFEHTLEAAYAALTNDLPENRGFLRPEALLAIVFVTDEDDCSAPAQSDLFDRNRLEYGWLSSYRCTRFGLVCGAPPSPPPYETDGAMLAMCAPAPNPDGAGPGKLFDVSRYITRFTRPASEGGLKTNPRRVFLIAIDGPDDRVEVQLRRPGSGNWPDECMKFDPMGNPPCVPVLAPACVNQSQPELSADPAVRLNTVVRAASNHAISSICASDYTPALNAVAKNVVSPWFACVEAPLGPDLAKADCTVEMRASIEGMRGSWVNVPRCAEGGARPCFRVERKAFCEAITPDSAALFVDWGAKGPPLGGEVRAACRRPC